MVIHIKTDLHALDCIAAAWNKNSREKGLIPRYCIIGKLTEVFYRIWHNESSLGKTLYFDYTVFKRNFLV